MRARRLEREQRRESLGVVVLSALAERDAVVAACEARAGAALVTLTGQEGLTLVDAVEWCGGAEVLTVREAGRLRQAVPAVVDGAAGSTSTDVASDASASAGAADRRSVFARPTSDRGPTEPATVVADGLA